ncbi:MAG: hypothetical protein J7K95_05015 [Thermoplasmata archaeon]|nr:hypothetical protein [Thermoplasmata archaeon]
MKQLLVISLISLLFPQTVQINVAIYFSFGEYAQEVKDAIDYSWIKDGVKYEIVPEIITKKEIKNGELKNYDVLIIPGESRIYFDAIDKKWKDEIKKFVSDGNGYIGICGGANIASPRFLGIANITINDDQWQEWQYLWKANWSHGGVPLKVYIPYSDNPIFKGFYGSYRNIRYWGGAGMTGGVTPIAIFAEEPCEVAPLHYWIWLGKWIPWKNITTDIKGEYAVVATQYKKGRVVLFSPHPEKDTFLDGHVEELPVHPELTPFTWFMYNWVGNKSNVSYNWWILRRSVAWAADAKIPPASETMIYIEEPRNGIYIEGRKIMECRATIISGNTFVAVSSINISKCSLYVDGEKIKEGNDSIKTWLSFKKGFHTITAAGWNGKEEAKNELKIFAI